MPVFVLPENKEYLEEESNGQQVYGCCINKNVEALA